MAFQFRDRVVLLDTAHNREGDCVGAAGTVVGISRDDEERGAQVGYAVALDIDGLTHFVLSDGLTLEQR